MPGSAAAGMAGLVAGYFLKTTVVLTLALLAAAAARRRPAALRHFLLSSALAGLLLLPLLSLAPVGWRSPLLPGWMAPAAPAAAERGSGPMSDADSDIPGLSRSAARPVEAGTNVESSAAWAFPTADGSWASETRPERPDVVSLATGRAPLSSASPMRPPDAAKGGKAKAVDLLVSLLWSAGLAVLVLRLAVGLAGAIRLTSEGTPLGGPVWRVLLERFLALVPLRRKIRLRSHPEVFVPLTWGWRRPVVLLPAGADAWTEEERSSALFHELSHVKRADFLVMLLVRTSLALFWWNPLCWIVYRELLKERELACDELVLRAGIRPSSYAASLLAFRRSAGFRWNPSTALLGMLGRASFQDRLAAILKQKLTLMEVKMKTKIMLALALVLAVALVGTARPVSGIEAGAAAATPVDTAISSPALFDVALADFGAAGSQTGTVAQEKEQEKLKAAEKAKEAEKAEKAAKEKAAGSKTIIVKPVAAAGKPIEITITEGEGVKTLVIEKPLTISKSEDGNAIVLTVDGKDIEVLKGQPLRLEIKGGGLQILGGGKDWKLARELGEGGELKLIKEAGGEGKTVVFYGTAEPKVAVGKVTVAEKADAVEVAPEVFVRVRKDQKEGEKWVEVAPVKEAKKVIVKEGEPGMAWTVTGSGKEGVWVGLGGTEMLEKIQALQEQVQAIKAKKLDLSALEESLKKLEAELQAKEEKLKELKVKLDKAPEAVAWAKAIRADEAEPEGKAGVWVLEKQKVAQTEKIEVVTESGDKSDGTISMIFTGQEGEAGKAAFERAIAALKKDLPEGYKLTEQKYDADKGTMTFKIAAPEGKTTDQTLVRKLVGSVKDAIKAAK